MITKEAVEAVMTLIQLEHPEWSWTYMLQHDAVEYVVTGQHGSRGVVLGIPAQEPVHFLSYTLERARNCVRNTTA